MYFLSGWFFTSGNVCVLNNVVKLFNRRIKKFILKDPVGLLNSKKVFYASRRRVQQQQKIMDFSIKFRTPPTHPFNEKKRYTCLGSNSVIWVIWQLSGGSFRRLRSSNLLSDHNFSLGCPPPTKIEEKKILLKQFLGNIMCFDFMIKQKNYT